MGCDLLRHVSIRRRSNRSPSGFGCSCCMGLSSIGELCRHPPMPGGDGTAVAFLAEVAITFVLMTVILHISNNPRLHKLTGLCAGALVAVYITFEAPISGMSMNPARTLASAVPAHHWHALWLYFTAPLVGMLSAAEVYVRTRGAQSVACAKLHHENSKRCIFCGKSCTT
jgi:aquaporin Z